MSLNWHPQTRVKYYPTIIKYICKRQIIPCTCHIIDIDNKTASDSVIGNLEIFPHIERGEVIVDLDITPMLQFTNLHTSTVLKLIRVKTGKATLVDYILEGGFGANPAHEMFIGHN